MKKFYLFLLSCLFEILIQSCNNTNINYNLSSKFPLTIHVDFSKVSSDSFNLSEIAQNIEYIPLESNSNSFLDYFEDFQITSENILIRNKLSIFIFDLNGIFKGKLFSEGKGPGEAFARKFTADEINKRIYVFDEKAGNVKIYGYSGDYQGSITKPLAPPEYWIYSIGYFRNHLFVHTTQRPGVKYLYSCYDLEHDSIKILLYNYRNYAESQKGKSPFATNDYHYQVLGSEVLFKERFSDTIYSLREDFSIYPKYIIDLGDKKLDWLKWRDHGMFDVKGGPPFGYQVQSFAESESFIFFVLTSFKEPEIFVVYNKKSRKLKLFTDIQGKAYKQVHLKNDLDKIVSFPPMNKIGYLYYNDDCLYGIVDANDFSSAYHNVPDAYKNSTKYLKDMSSKFKLINEFSNPVIMKVNLK